MAFQLTNLHFSPVTTIPPAKQQPQNSPLYFFSRRHKPMISSCTTAAGKGRPDYIPNRISEPNYVRILDTTLRDGEQSPGAAMTSKEKLLIARELAKLGVDIIEVGFPAASEEDFRAVKAIAEEVGNAVSEDGYVPVICGFARCSEEDIRTTWEAIKHAKLPRIQTFIATSEIHMKLKLRKTEDEVVDIARRMVRFARSLGCDDVQFGAEDAARSDKEFLYRILGEVIKAGATTVVIPDTVGYSVPCEFGKLISDIKANTPGIEKVVISAHCHDDLGLSTANTIAGACAGARQVEVTINGIGERAGNAPLEEVVMALRCRGDDALGGLYTGINIRHIAKASKMVEEYSGLQIQPHKAIVGANAFVHQSGVHQDGVLKHKGTYEIMSPEEIGLQRINDSGIVLGKLSGRHALKMALDKLGYEVDGEKLENIFWRFKAVAQTKKKVDKGDLVALVSDQPILVWQLKDLQVTCGTHGLSKAIVKLVDADGKEHIASSVGVGPVDSAYKAVDLIAKVPVIVLDYSMSAETQGIDAITTTRVLIRGLEGEAVHKTFSGIGTGMDMVVSGVKAYVGALNNMSGLQVPPDDQFSRQAKACKSVIRSALL